MTKCICDITGSDDAKTHHILVANSLQLQVDLCRKCSQTLFDCLRKWIKDKGELTVTDLKVDDAKDTGS